MQNMHSFQHNTQSNQSFVWVQWELIPNAYLRYERMRHGENIRHRMTPMISWFIFQFCVFFFDALDEIDGLLEEKLPSRVQYININAWNMAIKYNKLQWFRYIINCYKQIRIKYEKEMEKERPMTLNWIRANCVFCLIWIEYCILKAFSFFPSSYHAKWNRTHRIPHVIRNGNLCRSNSIKNDEAFLNS